MRRIAKFILPYVLRSTRCALRLAGAAHRLALGATIVLAEAEEAAAYEAHDRALDASAAANVVKREAQQALTKTSRYTDAVYAGVLSELDQLGL